ncbi:unnamed protein product [Peniophora sp. CBMAI 1063]|nr:unnamed protein product [Peniophora sp. CBMAI 1063]
MDCCRNHLVLTSSTTGTEHTGFGLEKALSVLALLPDVKAHMSSLSLLKHLMMWQFCGMLLSLYWWLGEDSTQLVKDMRETLAMHGTQEVYDRYPLCAELFLRIAAFVKLRYRAAAGKSKTGLEAAGNSEFLQELLDDSIADLALIPPSALPSLDGTPLPLSDLIELTCEPFESTTEMCTVHLRLCECFQSTIHDHVMGSGLLRFLETLDACTSQPKPPKRSRKHQAEASTPANAEQRIMILGSVLEVIYSVAGSDTIFCAPVIDNILSD